MLGTEARLLHAWLLEPVAQLACGLGPLPDALGWTVARTSSPFLRAAWEAWGLQLLAATPPQARLDAQTDAMHASTILLAYNTVKRALAVLLHKGALAAPAGLYASHELAAAAQPQCTYRLYVRVARLFRACFAVLACPSRETVSVRLAACWGVGMSTAPSLQLPGGDASGVTAGESALRTKNRRPVVAPPGCASRKTMFIGTTSS